MIPHARGTPTRHKLCTRMGPAIDSPGYGRSLGDRQTIRSYHADVLVAIVHTLGKSKAAVLLGCSQEACAVLDASLVPAGRVPCRITTEGPVHKSWLKPWTRTWVLLHHLPLRRPPRARETLASQNSPLATYSKICRS